MRSQIRSRARLVLATTAALAVFTTSIFGQSAQQTPPAAQNPPAAQTPPPPQMPPAPQTPAEPTTPTQTNPPLAVIHVEAAPGQVLKSLSVDEAVKIALEQNLGVQIERLNPAIADLAITQAKTAWTPTLGAGFTASKQDQPPSSFLSGASGNINNKNVGGNASFSQLTPFGTQYQVSYDQTRGTTNNLFSSFDPQLSGNFAFTVAQPLLRGFKYDIYRLQVDQARKQKEITDVALNQTIALTIRTVRTAYWEYKYALASLDVSQQSLDLARQSLRDTKARVEIGTLAPIDVVQAESEVAAREEAVILAQALIGQSEDTLRRLLYDPTTPQFWQFRLDPSDPVPFETVAVNVNGAVLKALRERTDLVQNRKSIENTHYSEKYYKNATLPALNARVDYNATGLAGTQLIRGGDGFPPPVIGTINKSASDLLNDIFSGKFPQWTFSLNMTYPIGTSSAEAALASTRLQEKQQDISLRNAELSVVTQVRDAARQLDANGKRVDATRSARVLAERRLEAEEKKFAAGMSTSFLVIQAQRDLAQAKINELRAILDYVNSKTDYDTVQIAPVSGSSNFNNAAQPTTGTGQNATTGSNLTTGASTGGGGQQ